MGCMERCPFCGLNVELMPTDRYGNRRAFVLFHLNENDDPYDCLMDGLVWYDKTEAEIEEMWNRRVRIE